MKKIAVTAALFIFLSITAGLTDLFAEVGCPQQEAVQKAVSEIFKKTNIKVVKISPSQVPGLCEVQLKLNEQKGIIYTDSKGEFLVAGQLYRTSDGTNITQQAAMELNRFSAAEMERLSSLTAFKIGKGKVVYLVTDPQCPYCKKAEETIVPMAQAGQLELRVLLFPLPFHQGAKEESISIICDNKGIEGLKSRYRSENQCEAGKKKVEDTIAFLSKKGITGTPTYIFQDGLFHSGVLSADELKKHLGI
ncbi:MAG: DsbC family protein [Dissulfurimicrobium sp.]|uniref:DsbC family protein n=1 Tax=Dissulfurimicrobium TaxID=1769732 RepID=UPI001EDA56F4|nr:DsbC family protein [Dissulfurimicrobium hydrothermale]UKL14146.1 DsbC family protein [Dissulfurimicrobium hydrothermale]